MSVDEVPATMPKINDDDAGNPFASCDNDDSEPTVRGTLLVRLTSRLFWSYSIGNEIVLR